MLSVGVGIYYYKEACSWKNQAANDNETQTNTNNEDNLKDAEFEEK